EGARRLWANRRGDRRRALADLLRPARRGGRRPPWRSTGFRRPKRAGQPPPSGGTDQVAEGDDARRAVAEASRRTISRRDLERNEHFDEVSPEVGELDEDAFRELAEDDLDAALTLLADLTGATDERLR